MFAVPFEEIASTVDRRQQASWATREPPPAGDEGTFAHNGATL
jgi:hypothetical protein